MSRETRRLALNERDDGAESEFMAEAEVVRRWEAAGRLSRNAAVSWSVYSKDKAVREQEYSPECMGGRDPSALRAISRFVVHRLKEAGLV